MNSFNNLIEALTHYKSNGYNKDFNLAYDKLICSENEIRLHPEDFEIVEFVRFDGETDPAEESILYAIESKDGKIKGLFISAFGVYADTISNEMLDKLNFHLKKP